LGDEVVAVEPIGGVKGEETGDPDHHRTEDLVAEVEVIVSEAAALFGQEAVVRVSGGILGRSGTKGRALLHALEDEVHTVEVSLLHPPPRRFQVILFADSFLGPLDGNQMVASVGLHPALVVVRPLGEDLLGDHRYPHHFPEEVDNLLGSG
jgi:hypothetical protein